MSKKQYRVLREVNNHDHFFDQYTEYNNGYRMYSVEIPTNGYQQIRKYMVTREKFGNNTHVMVEEDSEVLPVRERSSTINLGGTAVFVYRPEHCLAADFRIKAAVTNCEPVEKFGGQDMSMKNYYLYEAEREGLNGYRGALVRVFAQAMHVRGMAIPANECVGLPIRNQLESPHYYHDTHSKNYIDRLWKSVRAACGRT